MQEMLTPEEIEEKLIGYVECPISEVPQNCHVRYFSLSTDPRTKELRKLFRLGGFVTNKDYSSKYVILSNGTKSWSAQTQSSIFYRKLSQTELEIQHKKQVDALAAELAEKTKIIERLVDSLTASSHEAKNKESLSRVTVDENSTMTIPVSIAAVTGSSGSSGTTRRGTGKRSSTSKDSKDDSKSSMKGTSKA
jgi:hypothetical protein